MDHDLGYLESQRESIDILLANCLTFIGKYRKVVFYDIYRLNRLINHKHCI